MSIFEQYRHNCMEQYYNKIKSEVYEQGRADLIRQFDESDYLIIHVSEYGEYQPCCYNLRDIEEQLKEQNK